LERRVSNLTDYDHPDRPSTAQPPPEYVPGGQSVYPLIYEDIAKANGLRRHVLADLIAEREQFGLQKYGHTLQVEDPKRRAEMDLLEELGDALCYAKRAAERNVPGADLIYQALMETALTCAEWWYRP
jgi:hypothetical protein